MRDRLLRYTEVAQIIGSRDKARLMCKKMPHIVDGYKGTGEQIRVLESHVHLLLEFMALKKVDLSTFLAETSDAEIALIVIKIKSEES